MQKILLMMTPGRQSTEALHWCLHKAKETSREVRVIYVVDHGMTKEIEENIADTGFIGDKPGEELKQALNKEYLERGKMVLKEIDKQGITFGSKIETELKSGSYLDLCEEEGNKSDVDILVVIERKISFLRKLFSGPDIDQLKDHVQKEIKVYSS